MASAAKPNRRDDPVPEYIPARMINEFVYCPRLFYYEWVESLFRDSVDTLEGKFEHRRVDEQKDGALAPPEAIEDEQGRTRSVTLASDRLGVIARMDLLEISGGAVVPVDYKHGAPRETASGLEAWPADQAQLSVQCLILRDNGYRCEEGIIFYAKTRQRVRLHFSQQLLAEVEQIIQRARATAASRRIPPPLVDSPKCPGCSLVGICLPDETVLLTHHKRSEPVQLPLFEEESAEQPPPAAVRPLVTPRDDLRPLYLNRQGLRVGKTGAVLQIWDKDNLVEEVRIGEICQVNVMGNIQLTTQAVRALCETGVPICYFSQGGWFYGITTGLNTKNVFLRRSQFRLAEQEWFALKLARRLVAGKIRNQRTMLQRNHVEPPQNVLRELKELITRAERAGDFDELLGIEGNAARLYFSEFGGMIKVESQDQLQPQFRFDFNGRNRRPPRDPVNALLSLAYSLLAKDLLLACQAVGLDPYIGFYHQPRFGRPALALDLMEPFRPLIADSAVLSAINMRMVTEQHFVQAGPTVALTPAGRKGFFRAYELRMDTLVTHPLFEYRVSYRRLLEIQTRLLARYLEGEIDEYPVFVTR